MALNEKKKDESPKSKKKYRAPSPKNKDGAPNVMIYDRVLADNLKGICPQAVTSPLLSTVEIFEIYVYDILERFLCFRNCTSLMLRLSSLSTLLVDVRLHGKSRTCPPSIVQII